MKVAELIARLELQPPDAVVVISGEENGGVNHVQEMQRGYIARDDHAGLTWFAQHSFKNKKDEKHSERAVFLGGENLKKGRRDD